jgi:glycosyltransferase involved in cell wall biosynthesis
VQEPKGPSGRLIRLAIVDDNPFVALPDGEIRPRAATFHRFAEAVVAAGPFEPATYLIPVRDVDASEAPALSPIDRERLHVVRTSPFQGIVGYLSHFPSLTWRNWPILRRSIADADLVWIKAPASNALLALAASRRSHRPFFTWVAGSARAVVRGQRRRGPAGTFAALAATGYDAVTGLLRRAGPAIQLDESMFTSVVTMEDVAATRSSPPGEPENGAGLRLAWAGRMTADKGIDDLFAALAAVRGDGLPATLELIGDGPERRRYEEDAGRLGLDGAVRWHGYVGRRDAYLELLRNADLFVLPSRAEGVPKTIVEAMAAGLPVVATDVGAVPALLDHGRLGRLVPAGAPPARGAAITALGRDEPARRGLRAAGLEFAAEHTLDRQASRVVAWMQRTFPDLPWLRRDEVTV